VADLYHYREAAGPLGEQVGQAVASLGGAEAWRELQDGGEQVVAERGEGVGEGAQHPSGLLAGEAGLVGDRLRDLGRDREAGRAAAQLVTVDSAGGRVEGAVQLDRFEHLGVEGEPAWGLQLGWVEVAAPRRVGEAAGPDDGTRRRCLPLPAS
jgi:hypothetical protein